MRKLTRMALRKKCFTIKRSFISILFIIGSYLSFRWVALSFNDDLLIESTFRLRIKSREENWNLKHQKRNSTSRCNLNQSGGWLDRTNFVYNYSSLYWSMTTPKEELNCQLHLFTKGDTVHCIDSIHFDQRSTVRAEGFLKRFVFVGDSRGGKQFYDFLRIVPNYDLVFGPKWDIPNEASIALQMDRNVTSRLLGLQVSYLYNPRLDGEWIDLIKDWLHNPPHLIVINMGIDHLIYGSYDYRLQLLQKRLTNLLPSLRRLADRTELIWMSQYPMLQGRGRTTLENIQKLNSFLRQLLQNSGVKFLDVVNPLVEEYARSCLHLEWADRSWYNLFIFDSDDYVNCHDIFQPGYVSLSHATQILLNYLCNRFSSP